MMRLQRNKVVFGLLLCLVTIGGLVPFRTVVIPEWSIELVDEAGAPVSYTTVRQEWSSSGRSQVLSDIRTSDANGKVTFPERTYYAPALWRALIRAGDIVNNTLLPHGSRVGSYSRVMPVSDSYYWLEYSDVHPMEHRLIVRGLY
jgi:hypothetical protein